MGKTAIFTSTLELPRVPSCDRRARGRAIMPEGRTELNVPRLSIYACALALVAAIACGPSTPGASAAPSATTAAVGGALAQRISGDWTSLDPFEPGTTNSNQIMSAVYDRLVTI